MSNLKLNSIFKTVCIASDHAGFNLKEDIKNHLVNKKVSMSNVLQNLPDYLGFAQSAEAITFTSNAATATAGKFAHYITISASGTDVLTLPNGSTGQVKFLCVVADGGGTAMEITPSGTFTGGSKISMADAGDSCIMLYTGATYGWVVLANQGGTIS